MSIVVRTASGMFKGDWPSTKKKQTSSTAAHLMLLAFETCRANHIHQKGSNINGEKGSV